jgi:hypothetical protein
VGYIKKTIPSGDTMVGNQLDAGDNSFAGLFPPGAVPPGTLVYKWDENQNPPDWAVNFDDAAFGWDYPWMQLNPGEGAIVRIPSSRQSVTLSFVGQVLPAFNRRVRMGWSIQSSAVPQAGTVMSVLGFPGVPPEGEGISNGDVVQQMIDAAGNYNTFTWNGSAWTPQEPTIAVGEAFWSNKAQQTGYWKRVFWTWP